MANIARGELNNLTGSVSARSLAPRAPGRVRVTPIRDPAETLRNAVTLHDIFERGSDALRRTLKADRIRAERIREWTLSMRFPRRYLVPDLLREDARDRGHVIWARYRDMGPRMRPPRELRDLDDPRTEVLAIVQTSEWRTAGKAGRDGYTTHAIYSAYAWPAMGDVVALTTSPKELEAGARERTLYVLVHDVFVNRGGAGTVGLCIGTVSRRDRFPRLDGYSVSQLGMSPFHMRGRLSAARK